MADELNWDKSKGVFESIFDATELISQRRDEIDRKAKIGREKLSGELAFFHGVMGRLVEKITPRTMIAPANELKELAMEAHVLTKMVNLVVDGPTAKDISMTLMQQMSSRKLTMEIEDNPEKEEFCENLATHMTLLTELVAYFNKPAPIK